MPLPTDPATPWPPKQLHPLLDQIDEHDAWYAGDPQRLHKRYSQGYSVSQHLPPTRRRNQPTPQVQTGMFWARPQTRGRLRLHVPAAADIATTSADLLFAEQVEFKIDGAHGENPTTDAKQLQDRLDTLIADDGIYNVLLEAAEIAGAHGGVYLRGTWDRDVVNDRPLLTAEHADRAVPDFAYGRYLQAVTFWREVDQNGHEVLRHLERHERGVILHGLYRGTRDKLGREVPLTEHESTAGLVDSITADGQAIETGIDALTVVYVPNMRPARKFRRAPWGRSDLEGVEYLLDSLDETYSSWMRDIRLGKSRVIVPQGALDTIGRGEGAQFDVDRETFTELNLLRMDGTKGDGITIQQFDIRTQAHLDTAMALFERIVTTAGYSGRTFGIHSDTGQATATEVQAAERRSFVTRGKKIGYWQPALADILTVLLELDRAQFAGATPEPVNVVFPDGVSENPKTVAETLELLQRANAATVETKVRMLHPEWDDDRVRQETAGILRETGQQVPDPADPIVNEDLG